MKRIIMGLFSGIFFLSACGQIPTASVIQNTSVPTLTSQPTLTPEPTNTPEPTLTPTEVPLPDIALPIVMKSRTEPVLTPDGWVKVNFEAGFGAFPTVQEAAEKLGGYVPWSNDFITAWHTYLEKVTIGGTPLAHGFDPNTVCKLDWTKTSQSNESGNLSWLRITGSDPAPCDAGTFPMRAVAMLRDDTFLIDNGTLSMPTFLITYQMWNPVTEKNEFRTFMRRQNFAHFERFGQEGCYFIPNFDLTLGRSKSAEYAAIEVLDRMAQEFGVTIYDQAVLNDALGGPHGLYDPQLGSTVIFGNDTCVPDQF